MGRRYLGLKQAVPIAVGNQVEVQIFGIDARHIVVRDLTTGILYANEHLLVEGTPTDATVEGAPWAFRLQSMAASGPKLVSRFRGRVVECTVAAYPRAGHDVTSLAIDEDDAAQAPYR